MMSRRDAFVANFRELHPKFSRMYSLMLNRIGLSLPQYTLLYQLMLSGTVSMSEISNHLGITKPAVTNLVDRLEEKKFLKRVPHPKDRRVILLEILPKGEKVIAEIQGRGLEFLLRAYDQFNASEHEVIVRFYATLSGIFDAVLNQKGN